MIRAMTTELFLDFLTIRMDPRKAEGLEFTMNLVTPDNGEQFVTELSDATLTTLMGFQSETPDLTVTIDREDLEAVMIGKTRLVALIEDGTAKATGDASLLDQFAATLVHFEMGFEIMPGTRGPTQTTDLNPYEVGPTKPAAD